uniref:Uncharacterized protein n=1 Tax=Branchiostoma floridae TaxID=7739 RepID=C3Y878_BRAFL|eukprot:XP_002607537.1 hypothetical protein BRAFLDRAFT_106485 [Branchiostoma floridae]
MFMAWLRFNLTADLLPNTNRTPADRADHQPTTNRPIPELPFRAECFEHFKTFGWNSRTPADSAERQPNAIRLSRTPADYSRLAPESLLNHSREPNSAMCNLGIRLPMCSGIISLSEHVLDTGRQRHPASHSWNRSRARLRLWLEFQRYRARLPPRWKSSGTIHTAHLAGFPATLFNTTSIPRWNSSGTIHTASLAGFPAALFHTASLAGNPAALLNTASLAGNPVAQFHTASLAGYPAALFNTASLAGNPAAQFNTASLAGNPAALFNTASLAGNPAALRGGGGSLL